MISPQYIVNVEGERWELSFRESNDLSHIGGFLMTYGNQCSITLYAALDNIEKQQAQAYLLKRLKALSIHTATVFFWDASAASESPNSDTTLEDKQLE